MIEVEVKGYSSTDWTGEDFRAPEPLCIWFHFEIGARGSAGADLFQIAFCNNSWIHKKSGGDVILRSEHNLTFVEKGIVRCEADIDGCASAIKLFLKHTGGRASWPELGKELSRFFLWEFEGYD
jgi:hypothetical protein